MQSPPRRTAHSTSGMSTAHYRSAMDHMGFPRHDPGKLGRRGFHEQEMWMPASPGYLLYPQHDAAFVSPAGFGGSAGVYAPHHSPVCYPLGPAGPLPSSSATYYHPGMAQGPAAWATGTPAQLPHSLESLPHRGPSRSRKRKEPALELDGAAARLLGRASKKRQRQQKHLGGDERRSHRSRAIRASPSKVKELEDAIDALRERERRAKKEREEKGRAAWRPWE